MAHLFRLMYGAFDLENITVDDLIDIVFTCVMNKKICELERRENKNKSCRACESNLREVTERQCGVNDGDQRWMMYGDKALRDIREDVMWRIIEETCCILGFSKPSEKQEAYFFSLFDMSWVLWAKIFSRLENSARIGRLSDYIVCVCKLKFR